jgi:hypothetical protein
MEWKLVFEKELDPVMREPIVFAAPDRPTALQYATEAVPPLLGPWHLDRAVTPKSPRNRAKSKSK